MIARNKPARRQKHREALDGVCRRANDNDNENDNEQRRGEARRTGRMGDLSMSTAISADSISVFALRSGAARGKTSGEQ